MNKVYQLYIPYINKDRVKKEIEDAGYKITFNRTKKLWEYTGRTLPNLLIPYKLEYISIPYNRKDYFKNKYSIAWDFKECEWMCSMDTYDLISQELD